MSKLTLVIMFTASIMGILTLKDNLIVSQIVIGSLFLFIGIMYFYVFLLEEEIEELG